MQRFCRAGAVVVASYALASCGEQRPAGSSRASRVREAAAVVAPPAAAAAACPLRPGDVRLGVDSIGGVPTRRSVGELRALCPGARLDTVGVGGTSPPALRFDAPGVILWAIQTKYEAYGDSLHSAEAADLWAATGDSVRFPDGSLVPMRVGALRALDSAAVVVVDHGDDGTGSSVVRCTYPRFAIVIDNVWPAFADSGVVSFARASPSDTARVWRVEVDPERPDPAVERACKGAPAT